MILRRIILAVLLFSLSAISMAHDLGLTMLECTQVADSIKIRIETPLSRLVVSSGLTFSPTGIQLDQSIRNQLFLWRNGNRFQPTQAEIHTDSQADMIRWEAEVPGQIKDLSVSQRFYAKDLKSIMTITLRRPERPTQVIQLDSTHPTWNQPTSLFIFLSNMFDGFESAFRQWQFVFLTIGLALVPTQKKTVTTVTAALPVGILLTVTLGLHATVAVISFALLVVAIANLWPQPSGETANTQTGFRAALFLVTGLIIGTSITTFIATKIGLALGCTASFIIASLLIAILSQKHQKMSSKILYTGSIVVGMAGTYSFVSSLLTKYDDPWLNDHTLSAKDQRDDPVATKKTDR